MAITKPEVEWLVHFPERWVQLGVVYAAGKWAAVEEDFSDSDRGFELLSPWVDDRKTAIGFIKLLKEQ
jgi:hypothetical protein